MRGRNRRVPVGLGLAWDRKSAHLIVLPEWIAKALHDAAHRLDLSHSTVKHHLAARWPWAMGFASALARVRAIPLRA
jgi:hypothetical protein